MRTRRQIQKLLDRIMAGERVEVKNRKGTYTVFLSEKTKIPYATFEGKKLRGIYGMSARASNRRGRAQAILAAIMADSDLNQIRCGKYIGKAPYTQGSLN